MPVRVRGSIATLVFGALVWPLPASVTASVQASTARTWVPAAYLMWRAGGLPSGLTAKLDALQGTEAVVVVAGDTLAERKPHPLPLLHAAALLGIAPAECVYVGDAERDVQAARNAGMIPLVAGFGYLAEDEDPAAWGPEAVFSRPEDLLDWLEVA